MTNVIEARAKKEVSFISLLLHNFFGINCHRLFENIIETAIEKSLEKKDMILKQNLQKIIYL